jgi:hypothetical protein
MLLNISINGDTIVTTRELCKQWALQNMDSGRASNLSFNRRELISYKTVVARIHYKGTKGFALFTAEYHSKTTTSHTNRARTACGKAAVYHVIVPIIDPLTEEDHKKNISHITTRTYTSEFADKYREFFLEEQR